MAALMLRVKRQIKLRSSIDFSHKASSLFLSSAAESSEYRQDVYTAPLPDGCRFVLGALTISMLSRRLPNNAMGAAIKRFSQ
jgi:hypothetical protein